MTGLNFNINMKMDETTLVIPDDVTVITEGAFMNNKKLKHIDLRNVTYIGARAFQECSMLETVVMRNAEVIGPMAFGFCRSLRSITTGDIREIGESAFLHCEKLRITEFPESITSLGAGAFSHTSVRRADLHWLEDIPESLFFCCASLEYADVSSARVIGESAFEGCESLKHMMFGSSEHIGARAFNKCGSFVPAKLPGNLKSIGENAFWSVREGLIVPKSVKNIGHDCFGPVTKSKKIQIYRSSLYDFRNYFVVNRQSALEEEHFYLQESAIDVTVLDDETGRPVGFLPLYSDLEPGLRSALDRAFRPDNTFDYSVLDTDFYSDMIWNQRGKDRLAVMRLKYPYGLSKAACDEYTDYLTRHSGRIAERAVRAGDIEMLVFLYENGMILMEDLTVILDASISAEAYECTAFLLKCQSEMYGYSDTLFDEL